MQRLFFMEAIGLSSRLRNAATTYKGHPWVFISFFGKVRFSPLNQHNKIFNNILSAKKLVAN